MVGGVELTVDEPSATNGVVVGQTTADALDITDGSYVSLVSGSGVSTAAVCRVGDVEAGSVRLDEGTRERLGVVTGATVSVDVVTPVTADHIVVAPLVRIGIRGGGDRVREAIGGQPVSENDTVSVSLFGGSFEVSFRVLSTRPDGTVLVDESTTVETRDGPAPAVDGSQTSPLPPQAVGGYDTTVDRLRAVVTDATNGDRPRSGRLGILLTGPHGIGKTQLLRAAAWQADATIEAVQPGRLLADDYAGALERLRGAAARARGSGRGVVHLPAFDRVCEDGSPTMTHAHRAFFDGLSSAEQIVVVAEATDTEAIPRPLVQGDRLSRTVEVPEPSRSDRVAILRSLARSSELDSDVDLSPIGRRAFGYVAADLVSLWHRALDEAADRGRESGAVEPADLEAALAATDPSGVRNATADVPSVSFDDIGGLDDVKRELTRVVEWPLTRPELFESLGIDAPAGVLLYGPPGTGKTMLARAVASTTSANFLAVDGPELLNRYVGESERAIRRVFDRARSNAPTVVFFDEIDALGSAREQGSDAGTAERVVSQLLTELDGLESRGGVIVIGATNRPDRLDEALLRPGRFDRTVSVPLPDAESRAEIFSIHAAGRTAQPLDYQTLAQRTEGYSGSDIAAVVREAGLLAIEQRLQAEDEPVDAGQQPVRIAAKHVEEALESVDPSLSEKRRDRYSLE
jgi:transitional endoplasmic reticulum ATPase